MCTPSCELEDMNPEFLEKLDCLRKMCGFPLIINCAYRSRQHDLSKGRSGASYHCSGRAVDIRCVDSQKRASIVLHAFMCGLNGVGVSRSFVHVDDRSTRMLWTY